MVTNPIQNILLNYGQLFVRMKDREVRLNDIMASANKLRGRRGLPQMPLMNYIRSSNFIESVIAAEVKLGLREKDDYSGREANYRQDGSVINYNAFKSPLVRSIPGRLGGTWVNQLIGIDAAAHLDKELAMDIYEILTSSPIFQLREEGGDLYKELTDMVLRLVGDSGRYISKVQLLAKVVAARANLAIRGDNTTWNYANAEQLQIRHKIQETLIFAISNGLIRTYSSLLELAATGVFVFMPNLPGVDADELVKERISELTAEELSLDVK